MDTDLHLILNEGPFGSGSGSITAYSEDTLIQNAFSIENGFPLGNVAQHMIEADSMLYVAVNNSNAIHGINRNTLMHSWSATVEQPRYLASDGNHLFVSNWKDSSIYVLDKTNGSLVDSIDMGHYTEQLTIFNNKLFAGVGTYEGPWTLAEIDLGTFDVKHHTIGDVPNSFAVIGNELFILCSGDENFGTGGDTPASIWKYEVDKNTNCRIIHPATDCEYDSSNYGISKRKGSDYIKDNCKSTKIIQTSIIGPEQGSKFGLLEWFLSQSGEVNGYTKAIWNGVTTFEWVKFCKKLINNWENYSLLTVLYSNKVSKYELLLLIKECYNKKNILIIPEELGHDRTLKGDFKVKNIKQQLIELNKFQSGC